MARPRPLAAPVTIAVFRSAAISVFSLSLAPGDPRSFFSAKPARHLAGAGELEKCLRDSPRKGGISALSAPAEIMPAGHLQQRRPVRNQLPRLRQLVGRAKWIGRPTDEERGYAEVWKVGDAEVARTPRRMQRIRLKQEGARQRGLGGKKHGGLAAAVGVTAEEETAAHALPKYAKRRA